MGKSTEQEICDLVLADIERHNRFVESSLEKLKAMRDRNLKWELSKKKKAEAKRKK
jgi:hypothetical protein